MLYKALTPGTDDDRMKGALWTLNLSSMGKYAVGEPTLAPEILEMLVRCQHNEKVGSSYIFSIFTFTELCIALDPRLCASSG